MAQQNSFPKSHFSLLVIKQRGDSRKKLRWVDIIGSFHDKVFENDAKYKNLLHYIESPME